VDHARYGAISMHLSDDEGAMPLVIVRTPGRAPIGRVLLAPEPRRVVRHIGPIARHLLRRGLMFLEIEATAARDLSVSFETPRRCRTYVKGPHHAGPGLDHSYSELAVLPP